METATKTLTKWTIDPVHSEIQFKVKHLMISTVRGVFDVVKDPTTNIPAGTILYWSEISWHVVKNAYAHPMMGKAIESAPPGTRCVRLRLSQ